MKAIKAFLFDLDGTLIDSEYFHYECWNEILAEYNHDLDYEDWLRNYAGVPLPVNARTLLEKFDLNTPLHDLIVRRENLTLERLETKDVNLMPHVLDFINYFHQKGITLAIVTSSPRPDVEATFKRNGLRRYFDLIITRSDVQNSKPHPESYMACYGKLGIPKENCLAFEDTINGAKSAVAAGVECFAIQSNVHEHNRLLMVADQLFSSFEEAKTFICEHYYLG